MKRKKKEREERGFSLLEITVAAAGVLTLTGSIGYFAYQNTMESNRQDTLRTATATGYSDALDIMTGFAHDTDDEKIEAITAQLTSISTDDFLLGYAGDSPETLCVFAKPEAWEYQVPEDWDSSQFAASGACGVESGDDDSGESIVDIIEENTEDTLTELVYRCDAPTQVGNPLTSLSNDAHITVSDSPGNTDTIDRWTKYGSTNKIDMVAGREYVVQVDGTYSSFSPPNNGRDCLREIRHLGDDTGITSMTNIGANIESVPNSIPETVKRLNRAFVGSKEFNDENIVNWDMSNVENVSYMFSQTDNFNQDISDWDVSSVQEALGMFSQAQEFDQDISDWDISNAHNIAYMFNSASAFNNGGEPLDWGNKTGNVTNMSVLFGGTDNFNQDISDWDVSNVDSMSSMFNAAKAFDQDISDWDTSSLENTYRMFYQNEIFNNGGEPLDWEHTQNLAETVSMFQETSAFNQEIGSWETPNLQRVHQMFRGSTSFNQDISDWDVSNVTTMRQMFREATVFDNGGEPLDWETDSLEVVEEMFYKAENFNQDISSWDMSNVKSLRMMFYHAHNFDQDISSWDVSNVTMMRDMFFYGYAYNNGGQPLDWDVSHVENMGTMFSRASSFDQDLSGWDVSNVTSYGNFTSTSTPIHGTDKLPNFV